MSDDGSEAHEPLACVGGHFPASWAPRPSWFGLTADELAARVAADPALAVAALLASDTEVGILRSALADARTEVGGLRLRLESLELTYRAALADAKPARVVSPLHRALTVRPAAFGLHTGLEG